MSCRDCGGAGYNSPVGQRERNWAAVAPTIIHVADYSGPYPGSFVPMLHAAQRWVSARGWRFELVLPSSAARRPWVSELGEDFNVRFLASRSTLAVARWLRARVRLAGGDVVLHTHFLGFDMAAVIAAQTRPQIRLVWHKHGSLRQTPREVLRGIAKYGAVGRGVDAVVCVAPSVIGEMRRRGVPRSKLRLLVNGIDSGRFKPAEAGERDGARARLGLAATDRIVLHFGWDWHRKGGDLFLKALHQLRARGEQVTGVTVEGGDPARRLITTLGFDNFEVRIVEGTADVRRLYAAADLFASPSRSEGMPFAILEALSSGLPVVATNIPPHRYLADVPNLWLTSTDTDQIAGTIADVLARRPAVAESTASEAREWVGERLSLERWAQQLGGLYEEILARGSGGSLRAPGYGEAAPTVQAGLDRLIRRLRRRLSDPTQR